MRTAGIREARQNLSGLLDEVKDGQEIVITDRGRPVARLVPVEPLTPRGFPDLAAFRRNMPEVVRAVSQAVLDEREESEY